MHVDHDDRRAFAQPLALCPRSAKRVVELPHEDSALEVDEADRRTHASRDDRGPAARRPGWIVQRAKDARVAVQEFIGLAELPGVVAAGDGIRPSAKQLLSHLGVDPGAAGGVLPVHNDQRQVMRLA